MFVVFFSAVLLENCRMTTHAFSDWKDANLAFVLKNAWMYAQQKMCIYISNDYGRKIKRKNGSNIVWQRFGTLEFIMLHAIYYICKTAVDIKDYFNI